MGCEGSLSPRSSRAPSPSAERRHTTTPAERTLGELLPPSAEPHMLGELLPPSAATSAAGAPTHRHPTAIADAVPLHARSSPRRCCGGAAVVVRRWCGAWAACACIVGAPPPGGPLGVPLQLGGVPRPSMPGAMREVACSSGRCVVAVWSLCGRCVVAVWSLCGRCVVELHGVRWSCAVEQHWAALPTPQVGWRAWCAAPHSVWCGCRGAVPGL